MIFKALFFRVCRFTEVIMNLVLFVYGPYVAYKAVDVGEYVTGGLLITTIGLIATMNYYDVRIRKTIVGRFFHMLVFWEYFKLKVKKVGR